MAEQDHNMPDIQIYVSPQFTGQNILREVISGVEEESIPYSVQTGESSDATGLAYTAACLSILEVGIGVDARGSIAVHYKKLEPENPLFLINGNVEQDKIRSTCSNAARLVKGTPFIL